MPRRTLVAAIGALATAVPLSATPAATESAVNPQTGFIETVSEHWNGSNDDLEYTIQRSPLPSITYSLVLGSPEDFDPHLAISPAGDVTVVWTREGAPAGVWCRVRTFSTNTWSVLRRVSSSTEDSRGAAVAFDGTQSWAAWEIHDPGGVSIAVQNGLDDPNPFPARTLLSGTNWSGPFDVRILAELGHLWVTWRDDETHVGWSEYAAGQDAWGAADYQVVSGGDLDGAYGAIRTDVLNP